MPRWPACSRELFRAALLSVVVCFFITIAVSLGSPAHAQALLPATSQPDILAQRVVVVDFLPVFSDPAIPAREAGFQEVSMVQLVDAVREQLGRDPRFDVPTASFAQQLLGYQRASEQQDLLAMADQGLRLGMGSFRNFNLPTAIDELQGAVESYSAVGALWLRQHDIAEAWLYIALAELELSSRETNAAAVHAARARAAFREMIRRDPGVRLSADTFPDSVVEAFEEAYAELLFASDIPAGLNATEAQWIAERLNADVVMGLHAVVDPTGRYLQIQIWDSATSRFSFQEKIPCDGNEEATMAALAMSISRFQACHPVVLRPEEEDRNEAGHLYTSLSFQSGVFLQGPTRRNFANVGVAVNNTYMATQILGIFGSAGFLFSLPDPEGDLVNRVDTIRAALGTIAAGRFGRWRVYAGGGLELLRIAPVRATRSYWCKVSNGEVVQFDEGRECLEEDVVDLPSQLQLGVEFRAGGGVQLTGPLWLQAGLSTTLYVTPTNDRTLDFPMSADMGLALRF